MNQSYHNHDMDPYDNYPRYEPVYKRKRKWLAGLFSMFVPGLGHMYLGLLQRGLMFMFLIAVNISFITLIVNNGSPNPALVTIISLCIPITYFYTIFDVLQYTDRINYIISLGGTTPEAIKQLSGSNNLGFMLIAVGGWFFLLSVNPKWLTFIFESAISSYIGGILLVVAGVVLIFLNQRKK